MNLADYIRDVPDFPKKGIMFKDITPLLADARAFEQLISLLAEKYQSATVDVVAGVEARGFILGGALALVLGKGFVPIRKKGKLPWATVAEMYEKEYGPDALEVHTDAIQKGQHVLIVDDLLATGGTGLAAAKLVERLGGVPSLCFVVELAFLKGREKLRGYELFTLLNYDQ